MGNRKKITSLLTVFLLWAAIAMAAPRLGPVEITVQNGDGITTLQGLQGEGQLLLAAGDLSALGQEGLSFADKDKRVYLVLKNRNFTLETPEIDQLVPSELTLNFLTAEVEGTPYLNLIGLEKVLGVKISDQAGKITVNRLAGESSKLREKRQPTPAGHAVSLVWDYVKTVSRDLSQEETIGGLTVISPTWFAITGGDGLVVSKADAKYVQDAHRKGYQVWPLISNDFDCDTTRSFLADEGAQSRIIGQLLIYSSLYQLDGINLDFENVYDEDKERLTAFVSRLTKALKQQNLTVSMDVTVPGNVSFWSNCYDRQQLGKIVDYVMVMTYDEYWASSPVSGPVASIRWVENGIINMLKEVPGEKLLLGLPLYTRQWEENPGRNARSKTMSMAMVDETVRQHALTPVWLEELGLHYVEYHNDGKRYRIWIEDEKSLALKTSLAQTYKLAGTAAWRKGFEHPGVWPVINRREK